MGMPTWCERPPSRVLTALALAIALALVAAPTALAGSAAATPAADCQPYGAAPCLFPFPDDRLAVPDRKSVTGLRVHLPQAAMPANTSGVQMKVGPYDNADGFSPGSSIVVRVPGLDNPAAMTRTGAVGLADLSASFARTAPIVLIDQGTGKRQLIWSELDSNATSPATTDLVIHPGRDLVAGHTYIVALRNLRTATGATIPCAELVPAAARGPRARAASSGPNGAATRRSSGRCGGPG